MNNLIACRLGSYGKFQDVAWTHLPEVGIRHVELNVPALDEVDAVRRKLADHGLTASSVQAKLEVDRDDAAAAFAPQVQACAALGARFLFVSVKAGDLDRGIVYDRLRACGDGAAKHGTTIVMETHPDLITSGDIAAETMRAVNHPNVRVNYDTANVHYYNEGVDSVAELKKCIDFVAAVHLKDTDGGYRKWCFPALGAGIVDFPAIFRTLADRGFHGPYTMELEGVQGITYDAEGRKKDVADSVAYLRGIGVMKG